MILRWEGDTPLADAEMVAAIYEVSVRSVRRHCTPVQRMPPAGPNTVQALYDLFAAEPALADVAARPERTAQRLRAARAHREDVARIRRELAAGGC